LEINQGLYYDARSTNHQDKIVCCYESLKFINLFADFAMKCVLLQYRPFAPYFFLKTNINFTPSSILLLLLLALQPTVGVNLLSDFLPFCSFFPFLSPLSYSHYLQIFFNACNPSLLWSPSSSRTYRFPL